jgi:polygalacturonase
MLQFFTQEHGIFPQPHLLQTQAINSLIELCAASGGGEIIFEMGIYRSGTLHVRSGVTLHLPLGCTLKAADTIENFPPQFSEKKWFWGKENHHQHSFIYAEAAQYIAIKGQGCIDGNGQAFRLHCAWLLAKI